MSSTRKQENEPRTSLYVNDSIPKFEVGTLTRAVLVVILVMTLVGAMRWAVGVTNTNTSQVSTGLASLQEHLDRDAQDVVREKKTERAAKTTGAATGPTIDALNDETGR